MSLRALCCVLLCAASFATAPPAESQQACCGAAGEDRHLCAGSSLMDDCELAEAAMPTAAASLLQRLSNRGTANGPSAEEPHHAKVPASMPSGSNAVSMHVTGSNAVAAAEVAGEHTTLATQAEGEQLVRHQLQRVFAERGFSFREREAVRDFVHKGDEEERRMPDSDEACQWEPAAECVSWFQYGDANFSGCASTGALRPWCSHNYTYTGLWSGCSFGCGKDPFEAHLPANETFIWASTGRTAAGRQMPIW